MAHYRCQINKPRRRANYSGRGHREGAPVTYTLYRIEDDGTTTEVSQHETIADGVAAGVDMVENVDLDYAYALHSGAARIVAFREGRTGYRAWLRHTGRTNPSLEDKYDHDEDMLLA
jgi:hypothetical protein